MKLRQHARLLKQRQRLQLCLALTPRGQREPMLTMMRKLSGLTLPQVIDAMTDADRDRFQRLRTDDHFEPPRFDIKLRPADLED